MTEYTFSLESLLEDDPVKAKKQLSKVQRLAQQAAIPDWADKGVFGTLNKTPEPVIAYHESDTELEKVSGVRCQVSDSEPDQMPVKKQPYSQVNLFTFPRLLVGVTIMTVILGTILYLASICS